MPTLTLFLCRGETGTQRMTNQMEATQALRAVRCETALLDTMQ